MKIHKKKSLRCLLILCVLYWLASVGGFVRGMSYDFIQGVHKIIPWTTFDNYEKHIGKVYYDEEGRPGIQYIPLIGTYAICFEWGERINGVIIQEGFLSSSVGTENMVVAEVYVMDLETKDPVPIFQFKIIILMVIGVILIIRKTTKED